MKQVLAAVLTVTFAAVTPIANANDGMTISASPHSVVETINRLEATVKARGLNVFARIDHAGGASKIGKTLRPTELLIFGNPQGGTPFMECAQTMGFELPLKALAWEDAQGKTWIGVSDPAALAKRHNVASCPAAENLSKALGGITQAVLAK